MCAESRALALERFYTFAVPIYEDHEESAL
jgi:hypothetical protein